MVAGWHIFFQCSGFQIPSRSLAIGLLFLLWADQVYIIDSPHCECIKAELSFRQNIYLYSFEVPMSILSYVFPPIVLPIGLIYQTS